MSTEAKLRGSYFCLLKEMFPAFRIFGSRAIAMFGKAYACEKLFLLLWTRLKREDDLLWQAVMAVISSNISPRTDTISRSKWCQVSSQTTQQLRYDLTNQQSGAFSSIKSKKCYLRIYWKDCGIEQVAYQQASTQRQQHRMILNKINLWRT